jgi:hypothetical protein
VGEGGWTVSLFAVQPPICASTVVAHCRQLHSMLPLIVATCHLPSPLPISPPNHHPPPASNVRFHNHLMNSSLRLVSPRSAGESAAAPSGLMALLLWGMVGVDFDKKLITYHLVCLSVSKSLSTAALSHPLNIPPPFLPGSPFLARRE